MRNLTHSFPSNEVCIGGMNWNAGPEMTRFPFPWSVTKRQKNLSAVFSIWGEMENGLTGKHPAATWRNPISADCPASWKGKPFALMSKAILGGVRFTSSVPVMFQKAKTQTPIIRAESPCAFDIPTPRIPSQVRGMEWHNANPKNLVTITHTKTHESTTHFRPLAD